MKICDSEINFRDKLVSWCERTTFHAIPNIATNEHKSLKIMWTVCLIASISYCCRILTSSIIDYYEYKVLTTYEIIQESSTLFPAVTVCNLNEFDFSKNKNISKLIYSLISDNKEESDHKSIIENIRKKFFQLSYNLTELDKIRFNLSDMLVSCHFNQNKCTEADFRLVKNEQYGNCYLFNSPERSSIDKILSTSKYGPRYGLQLELYTGELESSSPMSLSNGIIIFIHNQSNVIRMTEPGIELSPGVETNIAFGRIFTYKLPYPFSECISQEIDENNVNDLLDDGINYNKLTFNFLGLYTQNFCIDLCYQKYLIDECNCYNMKNIPNDLRRNKTIQNCFNKNLENSNYIDCVYLAKEKFFVEDFYEKCKVLCPLECEMVNYKIESLSSSDFPSLFYERILRKNSFIKKKFKIDDYLLVGEKSYYEDFKNSLLMVNIYYNSDTYEKVTETPETSFSALLANMGGQFGLFLGISLLSLLELFELFIWLNVYLIQKISAKFISKQIDF